MKSLIEYYMKCSASKREIKLNINKDELIKFEEIMFGSKAKNCYDESKIKLK